MFAHPGRFRTRTRLGSNSSELDSRLLTVALTVAHHVMQIPMERAG